MLKKFIYKLHEEAIHAQRIDLSNRPIPEYVFFFQQVLSLCLAAWLVYLFPKGFSNEFAGYFISFLGIFIGLFTSIVITLHDKSRTLFYNLENISRLERSRLVKLKNYHVQFISLTGYGIVIGMALIILLAFVLLGEPVRSNVKDYSFVDSWNNVDEETIKQLGINAIVLLHRFAIFYFTIRFLKTTLYSITSYFTYLLSDYSKMKVSLHETAGTE